MSIDVMSWVWKHSSAKGNDRLVLLAIADQASDDGSNAYPSIKTLARKTLVDERTVQRCIGRLVASKELRVVTNGGPHGQNRYRVLMHVKGSVGDAPTPPGKLPPPADCHPGSTPPKPRHGATRPPGTVPPETSLNRPEPACMQASDPDDILDDDPLAELAAALTDLGVVGPGIPSKAADRATFRALIDRKGIAPMARSALAQYRPDDAARSWFAFLAGWKRLPNHRPKTAPAAAARCSTHDLPINQRLGMCPACHEDATTAALDEQRATA